MKFPVYILFLFLICSCHESVEVTAKVPGQNNSLQPDSAKQRLLKIIEGGWVNENYIQAFERLRSPMAVAAEDLSLQQMTFDISNLSGDTLLNAIGRLKYEEQDRFDVIFFRRADGKTGMMLTENRDSIMDYELDYTVEGADTILLVNIHGMKVTRTARFRRQFRKFSPADDVAVTALELYVNKNLFAGEWNLEGRKISFTEKGETKNFKSYRHFSVSTLDEEAASSPDKISFYSDTSGATYVFTTNNKKIQLYELHESADGKEISRGKMIGELKRE